MSYDAEATRSGCQDPSSGTSDVFSDGQFTSPDTILPGGGYDILGLSRYAYVEGNPVARSDPSGHCPWCIGAIVARPEATGSKARPHARAAGPSKPPSLHWCAVNSTVNEQAHQAEGAGNSPSDYAPLASTRTWSATATRSERSGGW